MTSHLMQAGLQNMHASSPWLDAFCFLNLHARIFKLFGRQK